MNARLYDPIIGRFLSPDPIVQDATDSQTWNAYTYVRNNPLSLTDPSGFSWVSKFFKGVSKAFKKIGRAISKAFKAIGKAFKRMGKWLKKNWKVVTTVVVMAVAVVTAQVYLVPYLLAQAGAVTAAGVALTTVSAAFAEGFVGVAIAVGAASGAAAGFVAGGINAVIMGARTPREILKGAAIGGLRGAIAGGALGGLQMAADAASGMMQLGLDAAHAAGHAGLGGLMSEIQGGDFMEGFLAAGAGALGGFLGLGDIGGDGPMGRALQTTAAAVLGGTAAEIGGGKFANGAITAAFQHLLNDQMHKMTRARLQAQMTEARNGPSAWEYTKAVAQGVVDGINAGGGVIGDMILPGTPNADAGLYHPSEGWVPWTRGFAVTAGVTGAAAGGVWAWGVAGGSTMTVGVGSGAPLHVWYGTGGRIIHAAGTQLGRLRVTTAGAGTAAALRAQEWFSVSGIPIRNPQAVLETGQRAATCAGAAGRAWVRGMFR